MSDVRLVSNSKSGNHNELLRRLIQECDEAILVSPFLFPDFSRWLDGLDLSSMRTLTLITTLIPRGDDQLKKPDSLMSLWTSIKENWQQLALSIQINNSLHGKVYLFRTDGELTDGIVSSANLTQSGLANNHEWGIHLTDSNILNDLYADVNAGVEYPSISPEMLQKMQAFVDQYRRSNPEGSKTHDVDASLYNALKMVPRINIHAGEIDWNSVRNFFFKPWGTRDDPVRKEDRQSFANLVEDLDFPKGKPSDVNVGDIVICFGTGSRCVVSVYQALSFPEERSKEEQERDPHAKRWPWLLHGQNYTPRFGGQWWEHDVSIDELVLEFVELYGDVPVTAAGGSSLGALQFGAGRLRLSKEFGVFVATKILELELSNSDDFKEEKAASDNESQGERAFHEEMINLYQRAFAEANYRARVFIQRVETDGGLTTAKSLINAAQVSDGYTELWDRGFLNLTVEAFVLENERFHPLFEADEIERCRSRLGAYGYFTDPRYRL